MDNIHKNDKNQGNGKKVNPKINSFEKNIISDIEDDISQNNENVRLDFKTIFKGENKLYIFICLLPILFGISFYHDLPMNLPIRFSNNVALAYINKNIGVFVFPIIMTVFEILVISITNFKTIQNDNNPKILSIVNWLIPIITILISTLMIIYSIGFFKFISHASFFFIGLFLILLGYYFNIPYSFMQTHFKMSQKFFIVLTKAFKTICAILGLIIIALVFIIR